MVIVPAYGRIYTNPNFVKADWDNNKDFKIQNGPYINKRDAELFVNNMDSITFMHNGLFVTLKQGVL